MLLIISPKNVYATRRLRQEANRAGFAAEFADVQDLAKRKFNINPKLYTGIFIRQAYPYLAEVFALAKKFKKAGKRVLDANLPQEGFGLSKFDLLQKLRQHGCPVLPIKRIGNASAIKYPVMLKWQFGFGGKQVFAAKNQSQLRAIAKRYPKDELFYEPLVKAKWEYKVITVGYKSLPLVLRYDYDASRHRPNMQKFKVLFMNQAAPMVKAAEIAAKILGRELAKVDILDAERGPIILEVNRTPGLRTFEARTKYNAAGDFVKYLSRPAGG